ncbi:MAG: hypothetical protein HGA78_01830, partial [Nitrospirales bacterium]|nr:hypothetical protein [Nitrospirales bacterium]
SADLERAIDNYVPPGSYHRDLGPQKRKEYRKPALDMLIERELFSQEAGAKGISVKKSEVSSALKEVQKQFRAKGEFELALKNTGVTLDEYRDILRRNLVIDKLLKAEVEDKASVSDEALEKYYNDNKEKFLKPEAFKVWHILIKVSANATDAEKDERKTFSQDLLKRVEAGESFSDLSSRYAEDDYRVKGGDLGWVHKGRLEPALDEALAGLKPGGAALVETLYGFHIIKLEATKTPEQVEFSDVKDSLKKDMEEKKKKENRESLIDSLKKKARIEIYSTE